MQAYAKEKHLGAPLAMPSSDDGTVELPAAVMQYHVRMKTAVIGKPWQQRDPIVDVVVPLAVLESLGKDVFAGQLVYISSAAYPESRHVARLVPVEACEKPLIPAVAASALRIDPQTCMDSSRRPVALLSPFLAFNLGIPYHLAQLMPGEDLSKLLHAKSNRVTISTCSKSPTSHAVPRNAWAPGGHSHELPMAEEVWLSRVGNPMKTPPFSIEDHADAMQAMAQAMSGGVPPQQQQDADPVGDDGQMDQLQTAEQAASDSENLEGIQAYLSGRQIILSLGDVLGIVVQSTPLVGAVQTAQNPSDQKQKRVVFWKVTQIRTARSPDAPAAAAGAVDTALLNQPVLIEDGRCNVMLGASAASDVPVGAEAYLLDDPDDVGGGDGDKSGRSGGASDAGPPGRLGRETYAVLAQRHVDEEGRLLSGLWRDLAMQAVPLLHPMSKGFRRAGEARTDGRVAVLLHGPEGSGKALEVYAAAHACGLKVVEYEGRSLSGGNPMDEAGCVTALLTAINMARGYAPVVLLIRRLDRIFPAQSNPAVIKRFADTLAHFNATYCAPHIPEVLPADDPDTEEEPKEPELRNLPWSAMYSNRITTGASFALPEGVTREQLVATHERFTPGVLVIVGTTSKVADVPTPLRRCFTSEYAITGYNDQQRRELFRHILGELSCMDDDDLASAAQATAGFSPCDLGASACDAVLGVMKDALASNQSVNMKDALKGRVGISQVEGTLEEVRKRVALDIGAPKIPKVRWDDVGGLEDVKRAVLDTIELPLKFRDLFSSGLKRRSGVLLYGPPGTGKTLMAKAVATECTINFMSVKGPELINMYVGESEKNVRDVFEQARKAQPCVLFFDELDSLAPRRGTGMDSSHVSDRVVAQLLAELDGIGGGRNDVYVIGATNRPDLLDAALMRPGRLDVLLYVGVDRTVEAKLKVLKALTRKFDLAADVSLAAVAEQVPLQCTGADMYGLCADAWMHALRRTIAYHRGNGLGARSQDDGNDDDMADVEICVSMSDFVSALRNLVPSLTEADLDRYDAIKEQYTGPGAKSAAPQAPARAKAKGAEGSPAPKVKGQGLQLPPRKKAVADSQNDGDDRFL